MVKKKNKSKIFVKLIIGLIILVVLMLIPFTKIMIIEIAQLLAGLFLWVLLLFIVIWIIRLAITKVK